MSVYIYRGDEESLIPPERLQAHLAEGWSVEKGVKPASFKEADNSGKLSNAEIREAAKDAGIDDWETARIKRLKQELGYDDSE